MKAKVKEKALEVLEKVEVEATGKVEVEALEVTKVKAKVEEEVTVVSRVEEKEKLKQLQEFATIVTSMDTLKRSVDRNSVTWDTKLGTLTLRTKANKRVLQEPQHKPLPQEAELQTKAKEAKEHKSQ